ncbi:hypothetical protein J6590_102812 [Homalodisca vitripennis]|nr:hypothetical protein J6590_102812 [Homalodisca vitripennis]
MPRAVSKVFKKRKRVFIGTPKCRVVRLEEVEDSINNSTCEVRGMRSTRSRIFPAAFDTVEIVLNYNSVNMAASINSPVKIKWRSVIRFLRAEGNIVAEMNWRMCRLRRKNYE